MKKIGLIGGMGPESTVFYYQGIIFGVQKALNKKIFPYISIESIDLFQLVDFFAIKEYDLATDYLMRAINNLANAGAEFAALTANTSHIVFDQLQQLSPIPLISIVDATCQEAMKRGYKRIGLLGTVFTMTEEFFKKPFELNGIQVFVPDSTEITFINDKIYDELEFGIIKDSTRKEFINIITRMKSAHNIEAIVLGCTELPLLLNDEASPVPCLDTMAIHIQSLIREIIG